ncbi:MAG TPA: hypothetical protein VGB66_14450 [Longimicrobium sp.]|jgi:hypothetical protein
MPITTDKNLLYGPPLVTQKYAPLENPAYAGGDTPVYSWMLTNRAGALRSARRLGQSLTLATPGWAGGGPGLANIVAAEAGHLPPLVVISSNRSNWIRSGLDAATAKLAALNIAAFANASDLRALTALAGHTVSPPIYAPSRVGANRNVYVVVHMMEYRTYQRALAGTGVTPVGWEFDRTGGGPRGLQLVGFGASRFAAMEFCKTLRRQALAAGGAAPSNYAWLVDDNVVALTNFAGFAAVEAAMGAGVPCAGLHGGTNVIPQAANAAWANNEINAGRGVQAGALPANVPPGIVQQMSLWNVAYLDANFLNFGPIFVASAEDLSITNYFNAVPTAYRYYNGIGVRKEVTTYDNGGPARKVNAAREGLAAWVTAAESGPTPPGGAPPPPVLVQPAAGGDGGVQPLADFVVNRVLPNSPMAGQAGNVAVRNAARCQAVEQLTTGAINAGFVTPAANTAAFSINGAAQQVVNRVDLP